VGRLEVLFSQEGLHPSPDQILAVTNRVMEWDSPAITPTEELQGILEFLDSLDQEERGNSLYKVIRKEIKGVV